MDRKSLDLLKKELKKTKVELTDYHYDMVERVYRDEDYSFEWWELNFNKGEFKVRIYITVSEESERDTPQWVVSIPSDDILGHFVEKYRVNHKLMALIKAAKLALEWQNEKDIKSMEKNLFQKMYGVNA